MNHPQQIHIQPLFWYQSKATGKYYLCLSAGWQLDEEGKVLKPRHIQLLGFLETEVRTFTCDELCEKLEKQELTVVAKPAGW